MREFTIKPVMAILILVGAILVSLSGTAFLIERSNASTPAPTTPTHPVTTSPKTPGTYIETFCKHRSRMFILHSAAPGHPPIGIAATFDDYCVNHS